MSKKIPNVVIIDYGMGNIFSVKSACDRVGLTATISQNPDELYDSDGIIIPGVGAFKAAMSSLDNLGLSAAIRDFSKSNKTILSLCLGMQLLFTESYEFGWHKGLDIISGDVVKLNAHTIGSRNYKVPHIGWNSLKRVNSNTMESRDLWEESLLDGLPDSVYMYFLHSFYVRPEDSGLFLSTTDYGNNVFCSGLKKDNLFAFQFHPEKSGDSGLHIYKNLTDYMSLLRNE